MPLIALTGGIASGKSTIAGRWRECGAQVIDADMVVRELQQPGTPVLAAMVAAFGDDILDAEGVLKRAELGSRVFGDPAKVEQLNSIVHPAVLAETQRRFAECLAAVPEPVVVYDVPLLAEARASEPWDLIVVAHAPSDVRVSRLVEFRGMSRSDAQARIASQVSDEARLAMADVVVDTAGTLEQTLAQADRIWGELEVLIADAIDRRAR